MHCCLRQVIAMAGVDRMQRHLRLVLVSCVAFVLVIAAAYKWGLPLAAAVGAAHLPPVVGETLSRHALQVLDGGFLQESQIPLQRRSALSAEFRALRLPEGGTPVGALLFRRSPQLGANAFTLPDGTMSSWMTWLHCSATIGRSWPYCPTNWATRTAATACRCCCRARR